MQEMGKEVVYAAETLDVGPRHLLTYCTTSLPYDLVVSSPRAKTSQQLKAAHLDP